MAVYVDPPIWRRWDRLWCHLLADDADELHTFAAALGLQRSRYQRKARRPWTDHYDIDEPRRREALALGAIEIGQREVCELLATKRAALYDSSTASPSATRPPSSTAP